MGRLPNGSFWQPKSESRRSPGDPAPVRPVAGVSLQKFHLSHNFPTSGGQQRVEAAVTRIAIE